ncbi:ATP-binding protein [archaeon]|nr:MAG: ATP-binding protein [archaeon]
MLRVEIEDHGIGMSAEAAQKLFVSFQQHQTLAIGNTGLGSTWARKWRHRGASVVWKVDEMAGQEVCYDFLYLTDQIVCTRR